MIRATLSKRALLASCRAFARDDATWSEGEDHAARDIGTEFHGVTERFLLGDGAPSETRSHRSGAMFDRAREWLELRKADGSRFDSEVKVAFDVETGQARILPRAGHRDYRAKSPTEFAGTVDLIEYRDGVVTVWDWKSTHPGGEPADATAQTRCGAAIVAVALELERIQLGTLEVTETSVRENDCDWLDALAIDGETESLIEDLAKEDEPHAGRWCAERYCPAIGTCLAVAMHTADLLPPGALVRHKFSAEIVDDTHAEWMLDALDAVEKQIPAIRQAIRAYADRRGGILFSDGRIFSAYPKTTEKAALDVPGAMTVIDAYGAADAVEHSVSWSAIERVVGKEKARALREALRAIGAVKLSKYSEYRARAMKVAKGTAA